MERVERRRRRIVWFGIVLAVTGLLALLVRDTALGEDGDDDVSSGVFLEITKAVSGPQATFIFNVSCYDALTLGPADDYKAVIDITAYQGQTCTVTETGVVGGSLDDWVTSPSSRQVTVMVPYVTEVDVYVSASFLNEYFPRPIQLNVNNTVISPTGAEIFDYSWACDKPANADLNGAPSGSGTFSLGDGGVEMLDVTSFRGGTCTITETGVQGGNLADWIITPANPQIVPIGGVIATLDLVGLGGSDFSAPITSRVATFQVQNGQVLNVFFTNCLNNDPYTNNACLPPA